MSVKRSYADYSRVKEVWKTIDTSGLLLMRDCRTLEYVIDAYTAALVYPDLVSFELLEYGPGIGKLKLEEFFIKKNGSGYYGTNFSD